MKTQYIEAPNSVYLSSLLNSKSVFLGGSITGAWDWQKEVAGKLLPKFNVINPRRTNYVWSEQEERNQINWEFQYLKGCDIILFYFSHETLAPITLFEYGKFLGRLQNNYWQKAYVCIHPEYKRRNDVIIQTELESPEMAKKILFDLDLTINQILNEN